MNFEGENISEAIQCMSFLRNIVEVGSYRYFREIENLKQFNFIVGQYFMKVMYLSICHCLENIFLFKINNRRLNFNFNLSATFLCFVS